MTSTPIGANAGMNLAGALQNYDDTFLQCRGVQHRWLVTTDMHIAETNEEGQLVERHLTCENCDTIRRDRWLMRIDRWQVHRLEVLGASYQYPENYLLPEMIQADHPREILRHEQLRRVLGTRKLNAVKKAVAKNGNGNGESEPEAQAQ